MKDFSNLLWLLILAGSAIGSLVAKAKENKRKAASASAVPPKTPEPVEWEGDAPADFRQNTGEGYASLFSDSMTSDELSQTATSPTSYGATSETDRSEANQPETKAAADSDSGIVSDFDLRKAVLWSEILKPKFDEE